MILSATRMAWINDRIGSGILATQPIPKGTVIWVRDALDITLTENQYQSLAPLQRKRFLEHAYRDWSSQYLMCWDTARYVNHSCECNCLVTPWGFEIAMQDIAVGQEITNDYGCMELTPEELFDCECGQAACRGHALALSRAAYLLRYARPMQEALRAFFDVPQPLADLFEHNPTLLQAMAQGTFTPSLRLSHQAVNAHFPR